MPNDPKDPKDEEGKDDNNSDSDSIKSTDPKLGLQFLQYDSDEDNTPPMESQPGEEQSKPEEETENKEETQINQEKENNSEDEEGENKNRGNNILHCAYCGLSSEAHLAQCLECKKWFCNGKVDNLCPSHIIFHLTKSKHKEVFLSQASQVGEITLQCYNCSCKNIFLLGFLESKEGGSGFIVCRVASLTEFKIDDT